MFSCCSPAGHRSAIQRFHGAFFRRGILPSRTALDFYGALLSFTGLYSLLRNSALLSRAALLFYGALLFHDALLYMYINVFFVLYVHIGVWGCF